VKFRALYETGQFIVLFVRACGPKRIKFKIAISIFLCKIPMPFYLVKSIYYVIFNLKEMVIRGQEGNVFTFSGLC